MSNQLQVSLQRLHVSLHHFETHSKCFSSRIFELRSSSMQSYHRLVKRIPWRSCKQERKFNAELTCEWITDKVMFCWQTGEARDLARDLNRFSSLSRVIVAIPPQSVFPVTSFLFVLFGRVDLGKPLPRGFLPLHQMKDTFPSFSAVNKEWLFSGFSYSALHIF